jgi:hypothetical protein
MKNLLIAAAAAVSFIAIVSTGCGAPPMTGGTGGGAAQPEPLDSPAKVSAFLEGKKLTMQGADIPSHPNGFNENVYFGASTQCYHSTVIDVMAGNFNVHRAGARAA